MRARRQAGFTLVELMVVVALVSVVGALAARIYSRGAQGEAAPGFGRSLMGTMLDARHLALTLGRTARVTLAPDSPAMHVTTEAWQPAMDTTPGAWVQQSRMQVPSTVRLCVPDASVNLGTTVSPSCPLTTGSPRIICFFPNGRVKLPSDGICPTTAPTATLGATVYFSNNAGDKKYRLVVWGLTGMAKLIDKW
jgi:prepilin-type N-terminal cleavage/methylation domain-containing protein